MNLPISAIIPTSDRADFLTSTLKSLAEQDFQPSEIIIIDASDNSDTCELCQKSISDLSGKIVWSKANSKGAAIQRNQGVKLASYDFILFMDDDILFDPKCIEILWHTINKDKNTGGVSALITNQHYTKPGRITRFMYRLMDGNKLISYAGKCIGPAWNILPDDNDDLPELVEVDWLNTTCVLYKLAALPEPVFSDFFSGYSLLEDVTLSLTVGKTLKLCNARTARIFHDSQSGSHKSNVFEISRMEIINRYFIMKNILHKSNISDLIKLSIFELFQVAGQLHKIKIIFPLILGKIAGATQIVFNHKRI